MVIEKEHKSYHTHALLHTLWILQASLQPQMGTISYSSHFTDEETDVLRWYNYQVI
jgi:hypothetical protein